MLIKKRALVDRIKMTEAKYVEKKNSLEFENRRIQLAAEVAKSEARVKILEAPDEVPDDKKKQLYGPFLLWMGFNCLKATATSRRQFTFYHSVPRNSWYSFYRPRKYERLSRPWSHPVVLITGPLDWESSTLTTGQCLMAL